MLQTRQLTEELTVKWTFRGHLRFAQRLKRCYIVFCTTFITSEDRFMITYWSLMSHYVQQTHFFKSSNIISQPREHRYRAEILRLVSKLNHIWTVSFVNEAGCGLRPGGSCSLKINDMITLNMQWLNIAWPTAPSEVSPVGKSPAVRWEAENLNPSLKHRNICWLNILQVQPTNLWIKFNPAKVNLLLRCFLIHCFYFFSSLKHTFTD